MSFKIKVPAKNTGSGEGFEIPEAGSHVAVLVALIDLGTQRQKGFQGAEDQDVHQVFLVWELVNAPISGMGRNHTIGTRERMSMHEKAKLRKLVESWRGVRYEDGEEMDLTALLGKACMVSVVHAPSKDGTRTYANFGGVSKLIQPKGQPAPKPTLPLVTYEVGHGPAPEQDWLPRIYGVPVKDVIKDALELRGGVPAGAGAGVNHDADPVDDDAPF